MESALLPQQIANYFLRRSHEENLAITQLKLLKLVYIGYGWVAALLEKRLFAEEIEAWKHGPVVPSLYHEFKRYGSTPIEGYSVYVDLDNVDDTEILEVPQNDEQVRYVLSYVWDIYKNFSAWDLRGKTHEAGTPWQQTYDRSEFGKVIPYDLIKEHFKRRIAEYLDVAADRPRAAEPA